MIMTPSNQPTPHIHPHHHVTDITMITTPPPQYDNYFVGSSFVHNEARADELKTVLTKTIPEGLAR